MTKTHQHRCKARWRENEVVMNPLCEWHAFFDISISNGIETSDNQNYVNFEKALNKLARQPIILCVECLLLYDNLYNTWWTCGFDDKVR